jgi:hypothetical protein
VINLKTAKTLGLMVQRALRVPTTGSNKLPQCRFLAHVFRQRQRAARKLLGDKLPSAAMEQDG